MKIPKDLHVPGILFFLIFSIFAGAIHAQWNAITSNIPGGRGISGIHFTGEMEGYCLGYAGGKSPAIYQTFDGGQTWDIDTSYGALLDYPNAISFTDSKTGYVATSDGDGSNGAIYKTTDAGAHWIMNKISGSSVLYGVSFHNAANGVICGMKTTLYMENQTTKFTDSAYLAMTSDAGGSWKKIDAGDACLFSFVTLSGPATGYAIASGREHEADKLFRTNEIFKTTDEGNSWSMIHKFADSITLATCSFTDENTGCICGYSYDSTYVRRGFIQKTTDGGITWAEKNIDILTQHIGINDITFASDGMAGYAVGDSTTLLRTTDAGENWQANPKHQFSPEQIFSLSTLPSGKGIAAGNSGLFYLSDAPHSSVAETVDKSLDLSSYPNPAAESATIHYRVDAPSHVTVEICDQLGRSLITLQNDMQSPGEYDIPYATHDLPAGMYLCRLQSGSKRISSLILISR